MGLVTFSVTGNDAQYNAINLVERTQFRLAKEDDSLFAVDGVVIVDQSESDPLDEGRAVWRSRAKLFQGLGVATLVSVIVPGMKLIQEGIQKCPTCPIGSFLKDQRIFLFLALGQVLLSLVSFLRSHQAKEQLKLLIEGNSHKATQWPMGLIKQAIGEGFAHSLRKAALEKPYSGKLLGPKAVMIAMSNEQKSLIEEILESSNIPGAIRNTLGNSPECLNPDSLRELSCRDSLKNFMTQVTDKLGKIASLDRDHKSHLKALIDQIDSNIKEYMGQGSDITKRKFKFAEMVC